MPSKIKKTLDLNCAFVVDEAIIRRIDDAVKKSSSEAVFTVKCSDRSEWEHTSLEELLDKTPNTRERQIKSLTIRTPWSAPTRVSVELDAQWLFSKFPLARITYEVEGSDPALVYLIASDLDGCVSSARQWHSSVGLEIVGFLTMTTSTIMGAVIISSHDLRAEAVNATVTAAAMIALVTLIILRMVLFPAGAFLIGDGKPRHEGIKKWRDVLGVGVILAFIVGLGVSFAYDRMK